MTVEYTNNRYDYYSININSKKITFSTIYWVVKNEFHNDSDIVRKYTNLLTNEIKRR